jgi:hypothetical protein
VSVRIDDGQGTPFYKENKKRERLIEGVMPAPIDLGIGVIV